MAIKIFFQKLTQRVSFLLLLIGFVFLTFTFSSVSTTAQFVELTSNTNVDPKIISPDDPKNYCWRGLDAPYSPQPSEPPQQFLFQPFNMDWSGDIWSSTMDHNQPTYTKNNLVATLGEQLTSNRTSYDKYDFYWSPSLETNLGYDGHDGHDFKTGRRTEIAALAAADGWVVRVHNINSGALGKYIDIYHELGAQGKYLTRYAHLENIYVQKTNPLTWVTAGEAIGEIGTTGASTGIHLHFSTYRWNEIRNKWEITDPFGWDPWLSPASQATDPLYFCNGEVSYNLWVGGFPQRINGTTNGDVVPTGDGIGGWLADGNELPSPLYDDQASFLMDVTLPDGTISLPGQSLEKTWRMRNSGTSTWEGFKLVFQSGNHMGASNFVDVPFTAPGQTVDISVNLTAPDENGEYTGYWQLSNSQGTFFGPKIWVNLHVGTASQYISILNTDPPSPANTNQVTIHARADNFPNFRAMRLKIDGQVVYEIGAPEMYYDWQTGGYAPGAHSIVVEVSDWTDSSWTRPETRSMTYTLTGNGTPTNREPYPPDTTSPSDWHVYYSGSTARLCAQHNGDPDGDTITQYLFDIHDSAQLWNSGWQSSSCVTTSSLGPYNYQWRVKVRDSHGAESAWSESRHFTLVNPSLSITELYFEPQDANRESVKIRTCSAGQGGIGITMRVSVNDANDGSANGEWHVLKELGVPCFNEVDAPMWYTLDYEDGQHLVRVEAHGSGAGWDGAAVREAIYTLPNRRPAYTNLIAPVPVSGQANEAVFLNSRTVNFRWEPTLRASSLILHVSTTSSPKDDPNPVYRQTLSSVVTKRQITFAQDFPTLYWQIEAVNGAGTNSSAAQKIGIDRTAPTCSIGTMAGTTYENVFQVSWAASDSLAGVIHTDIQYRESREGEWRDWLTTISAAKTYDLFYGEAGHSYQFRCRAIDGAHNIGPYSSASPLILVDPTERPTEPWWNASYMHKRGILVLNNMTGTSLPVGYPLQIRFDSSTTPSAVDIYAASATSTKCNDLRILYNNATELDRHVVSCNSGEIEIWFPSQAAIAQGAVDDSSYRLYYGNAAAGTPPNDQTAVWSPHLDANTVGLWYFSEGVGSTTTDSSGWGNQASIGVMNWTDEKFGPALQSPYPGDGPNGVYIPGNASLSSSVFTLEFFAKRFDMSSEGYIAGMGMSGSGRERMRLLIDSPGQIKFQIDPEPGGASDVWANSGSCLSDLAWHHIAVTYDGNRSGKIYCDGVLRGSGQFNESGISTLNFDLHLGSDFSTGNRFNGVIDQVRLSNIVRTSFPYAQQALITNEPSVAVGDTFTPPTDEQPDLTVVALNSYQNPDGGFLIEAIFRNDGTMPTANGFFTDLYWDHLPSGPGDFTGSMQFWVNAPIQAGDTITVSTILDDATLFNVTGTNGLEAIQEQSGTLYVQVDSTDAIGEADDANNIYEPGTEICLASADGYEGDDSPQNATTLTWKGTQRHNVHTPGDEDWLAIEVVAGETYTIQTQDLDPNADTYLYLYEKDGTTLLTSNDDYNGTLASQIEWLAPASGTYYLQVKHWSPNAGGCNTGYTVLFGQINIYVSTYLPLVVNNASSPNPIPALTPTLLPTPTPSPVPTPSPTPNPNYNWTFVGSGGPTARSGHAMAVDANNKLVIYGGTCAGFACDDTWVYSGNGWQELTGAGPSPRENISMVYDSSRQKMVLFGGHVWAGGFLSDTWEFNGSSWSQITTATNPSPRADQAMVYDSHRNRIVMFGGWQGGTDYFGDTWEYDGSNWQQISTANSPSPRRGARMVFVPESNQIILFGGLSPSAEMFDETWVYDGLNWAKITPTNSPSARYNHQMVYDPVKSTVILFGGYRLDTEAQADTWEFSNSNWQPAAPSNSPPATWLAGMAYYPPSGGVIMHGGNSPNQNDLSNIIWLYGSAP